MLVNWGALLQERARQATGDEKDRLFKEAEAKYAAALEIKPDDNKALVNWGTLLSQRGEQASGDDADRLFKEAEAKYAAALDIKPNDNMALFNWGTLLQERARQATGDEKDRLFKEAEAKYAAALDIKPDDNEVLVNWGVSLCGRAKQVSGDDADRLLDEAEKILKKAESNKTGLAAFNLACLSAIRGNGVDVKHWLEVSAENNKLPSAAHMQDDDDLRLIKEEKWFQDLLRSLDE